MAVIESSADDNQRPEQWLVHAGLRGLAVDEMLVGFCERLRAEGMQLARAYVGLAALHPLFRARSFTWQAGGALANEAMPHVAPNEESQAWLESPFRHMLMNDIERLHRHLTGPRALLDFPVLQEFAEQGFTDWVAYATGFGWDMELLPLTEHRTEIGMVSSFTTDRAGGFTHSERQRLDDLQPHLALAVKAVAMALTTRDVMAAYLGSDAARHVLSGDIRRGMAHRVEAAVLYADLRGFTALADRLEIEPLVETLNGYFDCLGPAIMVEGGQVLKFLGDGLLASFQLDDEGDPQRLCLAALRAAEAGLAAVASMNADRAGRGLPVLQLDIALHLGTLMYGNVGTAERLDFTLIGPTVNEAARIENLCGLLDCNLLASHTFAAATGGRLRSLGHHVLRGVADKREIFGR